MQDRNESKSKPSMQRNGLPPRSSRVKGWEATDLGLQYINITDRGIDGRKLSSESEIGAPDRRNVGALQRDDPRPIKVKREAAAIVFCRAAILLRASVPYSFSFCPSLPGFALSFEAFSEAFPTNDLGNDDEMHLCLTRPTMLSSRTHGISSQSLINPLFVELPDQHRRSVRYT
jgi:hypothetical protein